MAKKDEGQAVEETPVKKTRKRKLTKTIDGNVLTIAEATTGTEMKFDFSDLPDEIQALFGPFGMSQKLGDSAAGKTGEEAIASIQKVWEGLMAGNWTVRAPAAEKITKKSVLSKFDEMPEGEEKEITAKLLKNLGILA
ncbi:MAG: hypothetical protein GY714_20025 [Desulfobacterales bacterium]|nr:hypothetical protein [Desulfobacterales bacterium]